VPRQVLDDEVGETASEADRRAWIHGNLDGVLGAVTARETGGFAKEPWSRLMVEELP